MCGYPKLGYCIQQLNADAGTDPEALHEVIMSHDIAIDSHHLQGHCKRCKLGVHHLADPTVILPGHLFTFKKLASRE